MSQRSYNPFFSRMSFIIGLVLICFLLLLFRLFYLQVYRSSHYQTLSDKNRIHLTPLKPSRGNIYDRHGKTLAENKIIYNAVLDRRKVKDLKETIEHLKEFISLTPEECDSIKAASEKIPVYIPLEIKKNLSFEAVSILEMNIMNLPGLEVVSSETRFYPYQESMSHVLGYVGKPNQASVSRNILLSIPGVIEGKGGIEKYYESNLSGEFGQLETENNAYGHQVRTLSKRNPQKGEALSLTIDAELQNFIYTLLTEHLSAAAVVMDVESGEIHALVSVPGFDPNLFSTGITNTAWTELINAKHHPLINKAISGLYSPGSLIKTFMAFAILANKNLGKLFQVDCDGKYPLGSHIFHCWKKQGHGPITLARALIESCDVFFYKAVGLLGIENILPFLSLFKFGQLIDIDLNDEKAGLLPTPSWKRKNKKLPWVGGDTLNLSIGQGALLSTPLQWAYAMAIVANNGKQIKPHLKKRTDLPLPERLPLDASSLRLIKDSLDKAVNSSSGTARRAHLSIPTFRLAGKTSTSQVRRISMAERSAGVRSVEETPWHLRDNAIFVGYAPTDRPKYVLALLIEHGGWGGKTTGPLVKKIFTYLYNRDQKNDSPT